MAGSATPAAAMRNTILVCYDIADDKRLRKVFKTMRDFGDHLQYSVFECQFTPTDLAKCRAALAELINHAEDQVLFVDLGPTEAAATASSPPSANPIHPSMHRALSYEGH
jgi:CRISPR-associated protein Cas2